METTRRDSYRHRRALRSLVSFLETRYLARDLSGQPAEIEVAQLGALAWLYDRSRQLDALQGTALTGDLNPLAVIEAAARDEEPEGSESDGSDSIPPGARPPALSYAPCKIGSCPAPRVPGDVVCQAHVKQRTRWLQIQAELAARSS